jgi:small subunit ribosomal protein S9
MNPNKQESSTNQDSSKSFWATGRRKTSTAQVRVVPSKSGGKVLINGKSVEDYFQGNKRQALFAMQSYYLVKGISSYDFSIKVTGGGITGQAEAIRHGIARVLVKMDEKVKMQMRKAGYLTRDPRAVERKKPGQPKARKRFQYSKR